jgi:diguanylate cyclase (GGDEF)-like protein
MKLNQTWLLLALLSCLAVGVIATIQTVSSTDTRMREQLLTEARLVEQAMDWMQVGALTGLSADIKLPAYARLKQQLGQVRAVREPYRYAYLMGRRSDGVIFFLVDSESSGSHAYSPPGEVYPDATATLRAVFSRAKAATEGPAKDRWGMGVSALIPHVDPATGEATAILGLDVDARNWNRELLAAAAVPAGSTLGFMLLLGAFMYAQRQARREQARLESSEGKLYQLAHHDILTGLPNPRLLEDRMAQALSHAHRIESRLAVLYLDLDHFKNVNDSLGHAVGDALLKEVAARLTSLLREEDTAARLGGDEFVLLLPEIAHDDDARHVAEKVIADLARPVTVAGQRFSVGVSVGIALYPDDAHNAAALLACADRAMYAAKDSGRNTFQFANPLQNAHAMERLSIETGLRQGLEQGQFMMFYQPQFLLATGKISGIEALVRWNHPAWGTVEPARFIPVAEDSGLIVALGDWILAEVCRTAADWMRQGLPAVPVMVNVSSIQLRRPGFEDRVIEVLRETGLPAELLELELTETTIMEETLAGSEAMRQLLGQGVKMAIDDFGTGYSSLAYLRKLNAHRLKIDRSFIADIADDTEAAAIVSSMIAMARALNLKVTAEGVETGSQAERLAELGCDSVQGFHFASPMSGAEIIARYAYE